MSLVSVSDTQLHESCVSIRYTAESVSVSDTQLSLCQYQIHSCMSLASVSDTQLSLCQYQIHSCIHCVSVSKELNTNKAGPRPVCYIIIILLNIFMCSQHNTGLGIIQAALPHAGMMSCCSVGKKSLPTVPRSHSYAQLLCSILNEYNIIIHVNTMYVYTQRRPRG